MFDLKKLISIVVSFILIIIPSLSVSGISAKAAVVINGDTGDILYSVNSDVRLPMASTTKIMTALVLLENCKDLDAEIVTTKEMVTVEGSSMGLLPGDTVSYRALLYGMMLSSGNDAANTVAISVGGSIDGFVDLMNKKTEDLGLKSTHFKTPSGLDAEEHYTTAYELAIIASEALKKPEFQKAVSSKSATLNYGNPPYRRTISNHNKLLKMYDDVVGVKTGFTKKSGRCLVSAAKKDGKFVIAVTLNDGDDWADHRFLLDTGLGAIEVYDYNPEKSDYSIAVLGGDMDFAKLSVGSASFCIPKNANIKAVTCLPKFLYAPVKENDIVGNIEYYYGDRLIYKSNIICKENISRSKQNKLTIILEIFKEMMSFI